MLIAISLHLWILHYLSRTTSARNYLISMDAITIFFMCLSRMKNRRTIACVITPNKVKLKVDCKLQIAACDRSANRDLNEIDRATKLNHDSLCAFDRDTCRDYD